jgi:hypothetical protein
MPILGEIRMMTSDGPAHLRHLHLLGWLECDGRSLNQLRYRKFFEVLCERVGERPQFHWGTRDATTSFRIPDLRGMFVRGVRGQYSDAEPDAQPYDDAWADPEWNSRAYRGAGAPATPAGRVATVQGFAVHAHNHQRNTQQFGARLDYVEGAQTYLGNGNDGGLTIANGGAETRPANVAVLYVIFAGTPRMQTDDSTVVAYPEGERMTQDEFDQLVSE